MTANNRLGYLKSVYNELQKLDVIDYPCPFTRIMSGGHSVTLKEILGHASLSMTMRYAHLAPEHLHDAIRLGPMADISLQLANP